MKKYFIILLILFPLISFSQDLIVSINNDSINCTVLKKTNKNYHYTLENQSDTFKIANKDVLIFESGYYSRIRNKEKSKTIFSKLSSEEDNYQYDFLSIGFNAKKKFLYKNPERLLLRKMSDSYNKSISSGYCFGGDLTYYMNKYLGMGIRGDYVYSSAKQDSLPYTYSYEDTDSVLHQVSGIGYLSDNIGLFSAELFISGKYNFKRSYVYADIGLTMFRFTNKHFDYYIEQKIKGEAYGFTLNLGYDVKIIKYLSLGVNATYSQATLSTISIDASPRNLSKDSKIYLNNFSVGLNLKVWLSKK